MNYVVHVFYSLPQDDLSGQNLLDVVFARLNLIETAYFGLRYLDNENQTVCVESLYRRTCVCEAVYLTIKYAHSTGSIRPRAFPGSCEAAPRWRSTTCTSV